MSDTIKNITTPNVLVVSRLILEDDSGRILMIQRAFDDVYLPGSWEFPGGKLEVGQDIITCTKRETLEEVGLDFTEMKPLVYVDSFIIPSGRYEGKTFIGVYSLATALSTEVKLSFEHNDYRWCNYDEALSLEMDEQIRKAMVALKNLL